jgi:hypothetical protein
MSTIDQINFKDKMTISKASRVASILVLCLGSFAVITRGQSDSLKAGFENPPASARPQVLWHWVNGNVTKEGIKLDLEWMHRIGLSGIMICEGDVGVPQVVDKRITFGSPVWSDVLKYTTRFADQLGLEETIAGSPGWSESGGPWVQPSEGMKKYVWSETAIEGDKPFNGTLAHPPSVTGPFQNISIHRANPVPQYYRDVAVVAYRKDNGNRSKGSLHPTITASTTPFNSAILTDGDFDKTVKLAVPLSGEKAWIQYEFDQPQTIRSITFATRDPGGSASILAGIIPPERFLETSEDGRQFKVAAELSVGSSPEYTISFPAVTAKYFRVTFKRAPATSTPAWALRLDPSAMGMKLSQPKEAYEIAELVLSAEARINRYEEKAAFAPKAGLEKFPTPDFPKEDVIAKADVIDLTAKMHPDGTLEWTPPTGHWVVLRFGYSLLGITNHPAQPEATGLEVDKLNRNYVGKYLNTYLDIYKNAVGADFMGRRGIRYVENDSWEAGSQNWTDNMIEQFRRLRGYDPLPWMPILTGQIVESSAVSERFLWDFRRTISDMIATEHYGQLASALHERGMGHYAESHEGGRGFVADGMEVKKYTDIPMGAMWTQRLGVNNDMYPYITDLRETASVAHIYGKELASAESMTAAAAPWAWSPATLKPTVDNEFANGINRIVIHESTHQPLIAKAPGLALGPFGQWFNRNDTWAELARPWIDYIARSSYLLQQGKYGADIVYFYGEDSNLTGIFGEAPPNIPRGYAYDYVNPDGLIHELNVSNGLLSTRHGMTYRVLALDPRCKHMSLSVLRALYNLAKDGATIVGAKPDDDSSLADDLTEFQRLADELFGNGKEINHIGNGVVFAGHSLHDALKEMQLTPDFDYTNAESDSQLMFVHRKLKDGDIYFINNRNNAIKQIDASFRINGKIPELWHAETGKTEPVSYAIRCHRTTVSLGLEPWGSVFVVFRKSTRAVSQILPSTTKRQVATVSGPWTVSFQADRGAPKCIVLDKLLPWSESQDPGVRYFSGTATYTTKIIANSAWFKNGAHIWIHLGDVKDLAQVAVNGKLLGILWHEPYRIDATVAMKPGVNEISVKVTNTWVNRLIGDQQPNTITKYTFTTRNPYQADLPLPPAGLLGPVVLYRLCFAKACHDDRSRR